MKNRKNTVLLVEDDHDLRSLTLELLADQGYEVVAARNGREAVTMIMAGLDPDLVVLDLRMPVMSGPELLEWLRAQSAVRDVPVLIVSCEDRHRVAHLPVQGWLQKPPSISELLSTIERLCSAGVSARHAGRRRSGSGSWSTLRVAM